MAKRRVVIEFLGQDKSASKAAGDVEKSTGKMGAKLASIGKTAAVGLAGVGVAGIAVGKQMFTLGSQLEQMDGKAKTVFGSQIGQVDKWAKANAAAMGLTKREATGLAANFGDLLIPMGFTREQAAKMSTDVVGLSGALSQWSGGTKSAAEVTEILSAAMLGETDGLKALGISISAADIEAQLLAKGQSKLTGAARQQAEAQAVQALIMAKSTDAQAAFAKGGSPLLSSQAKIKSSLLEVRDSIAVGLLPAFGRMAGWIADTGVPALKSFGAWFSENMMPKLRAFGDWIQKNALPLLKNLIMQGLESARSSFERVRKAVQDNEPQLRKFAAAVGSVWSWVSQKLGPVLGWLAGQQMAWVGRQIQFVIVAISKFVSAIEWTVQKVRGAGQAISAGWTGVKTTTQSALAYVTEKFLGFVSHMLSGAAKAFGWVPGIGDKLKNAARDFARFRDDVNARLAGIKDQQLNFTIKYTSSGVNVSTPSSVGRRATGGPIHGPGTGTSDDVPIMASDGEHMMTADEVRKAGGHGAVFRLRRAIREGSLGHFAAGGPVGFGVRTTFPSTGKIRSDASDFAVAVGKKIAQQFTGNVAGGPPGGVTRFRGELLNQRTIRMLTAAERVLGATFRIMQGSYSTRVAASAGTHSGGGVLDTNGPGGWNRAVSAMRRTGFAAWHRTPSQGPWGHHIHAVAIGDSTASASAKRQVRDYLRGGDGLGSYRLGTPFVPQDGLYRLHRGERVTPAEDNRRDGTVANLTVVLTLDGKVLQQSLVRLKKLNGGLELGLA